MSLFISICFTSFLLDLLKRPEPLIFIDSIEDIAKAKDMMFYVIEENNLIDFIEKSDSHLAKTIAPKVIKSEVESMINRQFRVNARKHLKRGSHGFILNKLTMIPFTMNLDHENFLSPGDSLDQKLIDILHISQGETGDSPLFLLINPLRIKNDFNTM